VTSAPAEPLLVLRRGDLEHLLEPRDVIDAKIQRMIKRARA
jgi:hypothetical protein